MQTQFFVSRGDENLGPWTLDEIMKRLADKEISAADYLFSDDVEEWVPIMEFAPLVQALKAKRPQKTPPRTMKSEKMSPEMTSTGNLSVSVPMGVARDGEKAEWFVQKSTHRFGPLTYSGVIRALQEKVVYEFDHIWREGMERWMRIAELENFQPEAIKHMTEAMEEENSRIFMMRKYKRHPFECEIMVNDNKTVWMGQTFQASAGGSGMIIRNATLTPGQVLNIHFAGNDKIPAFNAVCEIVSKKFIKDVRFPRSPVPYGVKFIKIDPGVEKIVKQNFEGAA